MLDHQIIAGEMADERFHGRVVHRVRHVAHQRNVHPLIVQLPNRKGATEDAHVGMHPHHYHVFNPATFHQTVSFVRIGNGIDVIDFNRGNLP